MWHDRSCVARAAREPNVMRRRSGACSTGTAKIVVVPMADRHPASADRPVHVRRYIARELRTQNSLPSGSASTVHHTSAD